MSNISLAVITGAHVFEVPPFHRLFRSLPGVEASIQTLEDWGADVGKWRARYDAVLFYNMHTLLPALDGPGLEKKTRAALEELKNTRQGIIMLHHALLAFPEWDFWFQLTGMPNRELARYDHDQALAVQVSNPSHPITRGLEPFDIVDESYQIPDAAPENEILLSTDHPNCMRTLAWARTVNQARVFCLALGHDRHAWENQVFQKVLLQGITWTTGR